MIEKKILEKGDSYFLMRIENGRVRYFSFAELSNVSKKKKPNKTSEEVKRKFLGVCKTCGTQLEYIKDTNVVICPNENCKGKRTKNGINPVFRILDKRGTKVANQLFA